MLTPRLLTILLASSAVSFVALAGCSSGETAAVEDGDDGIDDDSAEVRSGGLAGTYRLDSSVDPEGMGVFLWLDTLSLKTDGTFYADEQGVVFDEDGYNSQIGHYEMVGKYTLKKSSDGAQRWIAFSYKLPNGQSATSKYFYKKSEAGLRLHADVRGRERDDQFLEMKLDRANAWCAEAADCKLQNLPQPRCPGEWKCDKHRPDEVLTYTIDVCRYVGTRCGG